MLSYCVLLMMSVSFGQSTLTVPSSSYADIPTAIAAAASGDTIVVLPGVYTGEIDFLGKDITLFATAGPLQTTLSGNGSMPVVSFVSGESLLASIEGFTISGGRGAPNGGGILISNASPIVRNCIIVGNTTSAGANGAGGIGGGIAILGSTNARIERCIVSNNTTADGSGSSFSGQGGHGGGIAIVNSSNVFISECVVSGNTTGRGATAFSTVSTDSSGGHGGGIYFSLSTVTIEACEVSTNSCGRGGDQSSAGGPGGSGGGIAAFGGATIRACVIRANVAGDGGNGCQIGAGGQGGGIFIQGIVSVNNALIIGNRGGRGDLFTGMFICPTGQAGHGGGIAVRQNNIATLRHITMIGNLAGTGSTPGIGRGIYLGVLAQAVISNSILRDPLGSQVALGSFTIDHSDVVGGAPGVGNFDADPLFENVAGANFQLLPTSPCRDTAIMSSVFGDLDGRLRPIGPAPDMGAYEALCGGASVLASNHPNETLTLSWIEGMATSLLIPVDAMNGRASVFGAPPFAPGLALVALGSASLPAASVLLHIDLATLVAVTPFDFPIGGTVSADLDLADPSLAGTVVFLQALAIDPAVPGFLRTSNGLRLQFCP